MSKSIGIDLGTTYSLVATVQDGEAQILKDNADGRIPSALFVAEQYEASQGAPYAVGRAAPRGAQGKAGLGLASCTAAVASCTAAVASWRPSSRGAGQWLADFAHPIDGTLAAFRKARERHPLDGLGHARAHAS